MMRLLYMLFLLLCAACEADGPSSQRENSHNLFDNENTRNRHVLLTVQPYNLNNLPIGSLQLGPAVLLGNEGRLSSVEPSLSLWTSSHLPKLYTNEILSPENGSYLVEVEYLSYDSLVILLHYSYTRESNDTIIVTEGTLRLPLHYDEYDKLFQVEPLQRGNEGDVQLIRLDVERLFML